ncbi:HalOD1 output domain-containing protein [Haloarcula montana]|uniref:HalOD1 output domain-containing protein n=1 Tax=Haloarcula montana TaxID=3111776 RepID=UPI003DA86476
MVRSLIPAITEAVADSKGVEPDELEITLGEYIDLDAVDQLVEHSTSPWTLRFELPDQTVTVASDGTIFVDSQPEHDCMTA